MRRILVGVLVGLMACPVPALAEEATNRPVPAVSTDEVFADIESVVSVYGASLRAALDPWYPVPNYNQRPETEDQDR